MAELVDASDLKSDGGNTVWVQVPPSAHSGEWRRWLARALWEREVAGSSPVSPTSGYSTKASISPFQGEDTGSIPVTRSKTMTSHQLKQRQVIDKIEAQVNAQAMDFSTVSPVEDYENDPRMCLTGVHFPHQDLIQQIQHTLIEPLRRLEPDFYYYPPDSLHMTVKSIRTINHPPHFNDQDVQTARKMFSQIIPQHHQFKVYFYRLLLFPNNLALIGTTDPELDSIILDLDKALKAAGIPDDKVYANSRYFFSNMTLARFNTSPSAEFKQKVKELSDSLRFEPYTADSVTLLTCNAVFKNRHLRETWNLV